MKIRNSVIVIAFQLLFISCNPEMEGYRTFPVSEPERVGISSERLQAIENQIQDWVRAKELVGAELLIIKNKRTVFHRAFGWKNLEKQIPMKINTIFDIRSMTKPLVGTAVFMLLEQGKLSLEDPVLKYIPYFDNEKCRGVNIDHLLMHTAGFHSSQELKRKSKNLEELVIEASQLGPFSEPGSQLYYSGRNSAFLAYLVERITGQKAETWIQTHILDPLNMEDTFCVHDSAGACSLYDRISHVHVLEENGYEKYWDPSWSPEFPYFRGGVGFYSTAMDYAKFLSIWLEWGISDRMFFQKQSTIRTALRSSVFDPSSARHWEIFRPASENENTMPAFGHVGDFGTMAYAVPESDLIICFFTQSRNNKKLGEVLTLFDRYLY